MYATSTTTRRRHNNNNNVTCVTTDWFFLPRLNDTVHVMKGSVNGIDGSLGSDEYQKTTSFALFRNNNNDPHQFINGTLKRVTDMNQSFIRYAFHLLKFSAKKRHIMF